MLKKSTMALYAIVTHSLIVSQFEIINSKAMKIKDFGCMAVHKSDKVTATATNAS